MVVRFVVGVLIGGAIAGGLFLGANFGDEGAGHVPVLRPSAVVGAPTEVVPTVVEAPWIADHEVRFESSLILPNAMSVAGGTAVLEFDLTTLGPLRLDDEGDLTPAAVQPERFLLITKSGTIEGKPSSPGVMTVRFEVPESVTLDDLIEVRLAQWRVFMPFRHVFEVELADGAMVALPGGGSVTVASVLDQERGRVARFEMQRPDLGDLAADPEHWVLELLPGQGWFDDWTATGFQIFSGEPEVAGSVWLRYDQSLSLAVDGDIVVWQGHTQ